MKITIGFSPCPNDTFIFDALVNNKIDTRGFDFEVELEDVQTLNEWAKEGRLDVTKISYGALPLFLENYIVLNSGGALGKGVGPLLIASKEINTSQVNDAKIAIPGINTTAHLLFSMAYPKAKNKTFLKFNSIENFVLEHADPRPLKTKPAPEQADTNQYKPVANPDLQYPNSDQINPNTDLLNPDTDLLYRNTDLLNPVTDLLNSNIDLSTYDADLRNANAELPNRIPSMNYLGVIIHENRFTYQQKGLKKVVDLGEFWERETGYPIPLGGIVMKRNFNPKTQHIINDLIRESIEYAYAHLPELATYVKQHSQEMEESVMRQHIGLYVNDYSLDLGPDGKNAVKKFLEIYNSLNYPNTEPPSNKPQPKPIFLEPLPTFP